MTDLEELNQKAWEIAAQSIMLKNNRFEAYSNGQIRGFFELAKSRNFENDLEANIRKYSPQPSRGQKPQDIAGELQKMKQLNVNIANNIKSLFRTMKTTTERMRFAQYLMWNIKIIEQRLNDKENPGIEKLKLALDCEKVKNPQVIIDHLMALSKTKYVQSPRK